MSLSSPIIVPGLTMRIPRINTCYCAVDMWPHTAAHDHNARLLNYRLPI